MLNRSGFALAVGLLLAVAFFAGVFRLFALRYASGDVYPPYSTFRADPLGAKAIYDSLAAVPDIRVERNFRPLPKLRPDGPVTLVYAGVPRYALWEQRELHTFEELVRLGSRAVFTFFPIDMPPSAAEDRLAEKEAREKKKKSDAERKEKSKKKQKAGEQSDDKKGDGKSDKKEKDDEEDDRESKPIEFRDVAKRFGFDFDFLPAPEKKAFDRTATLMEAGGALEREISWHSAIYFKNLSPEWKVLYTCQLKPVVIERKLGAGSVVLAGDSFFLSNEALRRERHAPLLARIFSGPGPVIFDEEHLGVRDDPGIASLARKYRLHGVVAVLALIALLFVWKNASRFLPAYDAADAAEPVRGKDSAEGFVNLLRRTIKPADVVPICVEEWRKTCSHHARERAEIEDAWRAELARPSRDRSAVGAYRDFSRVLARKSPHP